MAYNLKRAFHISRLIAGRKGGALSDPGSQELDNWLAADVKNAETYEKVVSESTPDGYRKWKDVDPGPPMKEMNGKIAGYRRSRRRATIWSAATVGAAACMFIVLALIPRHDPSPVGIYPGSSRATLRLASGETHDLGSDSQIHINEAGVAIVKGGDMSLSYRAEGQSITNGEPVYHEIIVGRSGEFDLELADGTHVWLNSESSLRYPVTFSGGERKVFLSGEAYFDVARDESKQFVIETGAQTARVLGTSLNITAYEGDHLITTTLISGRVSVEGRGKAVILSPGEQSQLDAVDGALSVHRVDLDDAIAWRNGWFILDNQSLGQFMEQISRWYDLETTYANEHLRNLEFVGKVPRYATFDEVLNVLRESSDLKISVTDKTVFIK